MGLREDKILGNYSGKQKREKVMFPNRADQISQGSLFVFQTQKSLSHSLSDKVTLLSCLLDS